MIFKQVSDINLSNWNPKKEYQDKINQGPSGIIRELFLKRKNQLLKTHEFTREDILKDGYKYKDFLAELREDSWCAPYKGTVRWIKEGYKLEKNQIFGCKFKIYTITDEAIKWIQMN